MQSPEVLKSPEYRRAFRRWAARGPEHLAPDELRVLNEGVNADGGYLPPMSYTDLIVEQRRKGLRKWFTHLMVDRGAPIPYFSAALSTQVQRINESSVGTISTASPFQWPNFGTSGAPVRRAFLPIKHGKYFKVTEELFEDSAADLEMFLVKQLARDIVATEARDSITGLGSTPGVGNEQICGMLQNLTAEGRTVTAAGAGAITGADLAGLMSIVDPAYIEGAHWVMHPLVYASKVAGAAIVTAQSERDEDGCVHPTIYGYPVVLCPYMSSVLTGGQCAVIFGDLSMYAIVEANPGYVATRATEAHISDGQIGLYFRTRLDGNVVQPSALAALVAA